MEKTGNILVKYIPKDLKRANLANKLGVKEQYLSNILNDIKKPSKKFLNNFYKLFKISEDDIIKIEKYELYRKVPEKIRAEVSDIRENFTKFKTMHIKNMGVLDENGFTKGRDDELLTLKDNVIFKKFNEASFFLTIKSDKYYPFFNNDVVFFKEDFLIKDLDNKYVFLKYKSLTSIFLIKIIDKKIVLNSLVKGEEDYILNSKKNLKVYGYAYTRISEEMIW